MKKSGYIVGLLLAAGGTLQAQEGASAYHFLQFPQSSHTSALGGANISAVDDDVAAAMNNPALLSTVSDRTLSLNFMTYAAGSKAVGAAFAKAFGERHTGAVAAQYLGYGSMDETDAEGNVIGSFSAKDLSLTAGYAYLLNDRWAGGASVKMIYSKYAEFSSLALAVDVGLNYYDVDADFSASLALKNLGVQLKAFEDDHDHVPYDLQLGLSKGIARAPIRFSLTLTDLTRWRTSDYFVPDGDELKSLQKLLNHVVVGVDVFPIDALYLSAGYNFRRAYELKAAGSGKGAGLSVGGGVQLSRFRAGIAWARYHLAASSLHFDVAYTF